MCITVHGIIPVGPNKFHFYYCLRKILRKKKTDKEYMKYKR